MRLLLHFVLVLACVVRMSDGVVHAQDVDKDGEEEDDLPMYVGEEIVVTGSR